MNNRAIYLSRHINRSIAAIWRKDGKIVLCGNFKELKTGVKQRDFTDSALSVMKLIM
jgi:hypothetical protein